jgi:hypothetical protein
VARGLRSVHSNDDGVGRRGAHGIHFC